MFLLQTGQASTGGCSVGRPVGAPPASPPPLRLPEMSAQHPAGKSRQRRRTHPGTSIIQGQSSTFSKI